MTCIVGLVADDGTVWMGGDAASIGNCNASTSAIPKVFKRWDMLIGFAGSWPLGQIVQYSMVIGDAELAGRDDDPVRWLSVVFVPALRKALNDHGRVEMKDGTHNADGHLLIGYNGRLFTIWSDFNVAEDQYPYASIGCGSATAFGSLFTSRDMAVSLSSFSPQDHIHLALRSAAEHDAHVRPPFTIQWLAPVVQMPRFDLGATWPVETVT